MRRKLSRRKKMRRKLSRRWNFEELCLQLECRLCSLVITDQVTWTKWKLYSAKISPPCLTICCNSSQQKKEERSVEMQSHEAGLFRAAHAPLSSSHSWGGQGRTAWQHHVRLWAVWGCHSACLRVGRSSLS